MNKSLCILLAVLISISVLSGCASRLAGEIKNNFVENAPIPAQNQTMTVQSETKSLDKEPIYISGQMDRAAFFLTAEELNQNAGYIISGEVTSSQPFYCSSLLNTLSCVKINQVFKGNLQSGDLVYIGELGGRTTYGDFAQNTQLERKAFEEQSATLAADQDVVIGYEGYYPMQKGQKFLLYLNVAKMDASKVPYEGFPRTSYYILGGSDGKLCQIDDRTFVKPLPCKAGQTATDVLGNGVALTITADQLNR